jgi:hypothetical protein
VITPRGWFARVVGLDLSLASAGVAVHYPDGAILTESITREGDRGETIRARGARIGGIADQVRGHLGTCGLVVVEGPAWFAHDSTWDRAGLWWEIVNAALKWCPVAVVGPMTRAKWATGVGRADKAAVAAAMAERAPEASPANSAEANALALAWMGAQWLGWRPVKSKVEQAGLDAAKWPNTTGVDHDD